MDSNSNCIVPDPDSVSTWNQLDGSNSEKTIVLKVLKSVPIIVSITVSNPKCIYLVNYLFFVTTRSRALAFMS